MSHKRVKEALSDYLSLPPPGYAFLLEGRWGVGKSHFWRQFISKPFTKLKRRDISISAAGLSTLEDLENALFLATVKEAVPSAVRETCSAIWKAALRVVKIDPDDIKLKAAVKSGTTVVCIDDVERFGGDFQVLFGFIKNLLDDAQLHVVIIADEQRAITRFTEYKDYRERIVQKWARLTPDVGAFFDDVVQGYADQRVREGLLASKEWAVNFFEGRQIQNLRTVRAILDEMYALLRAMTWPDDAVPKIKRLLSAVTFYAMATTKSVSNAERVSQAFLQYDPSMAFGILGHHRVPDKDDKTGELKAIRELIAELGLTDDTYNWPHSFVFSAYVAGNELDADAIAGDFLVFEKAFEDLSPLKRLENSRHLTDEELTACVDGLRKQVEEHELESVQELWEAYCRLTDLSGSLQTGWTHAECQKIFLDAIHSYQVEGMNSALENFWDRPLAVGDSAVWKALLALQTKIDDFEGRKRDEALQCVIIEGKGLMRSGHRSAPFTYADPTAIHARLVEAGRDGIWRMHEFYMKRVSLSDMDEKGFTAEMSFARRLAALADKHKTKGNKITQEEAAWRALSFKLKTFVMTMEKAHALQSPPASLKKAETRAASNQAKT